MKITQLSIQNTLGVRSLQADLVAPITLIAGANGAGKSSILDALRLALTGNLPRISLKKEAGSLVNEGSKKGLISLVADGEAYELALPELKNLNTYVPAAMPYLCDMRAFSDADASIRRGLLFGLSGCSASPSEVGKRLAGKGAEAQRIETILPMLRSGFPAAAEFAKDKAKEAKGAWCGVTNEAYGDKKADGWKALRGQMVSAEDLSANRNALFQLENDLQGLLGTMGAAKERERREASQAEQRRALNARLERLLRVEAKLEKDRKELAEWEVKVADNLKAMHGLNTVQKACACPDCGAELIWTGDKLIPHGDQRGDADAAVRHPEYVQARDLLSRAVANGERDLRDAQEAQAALKALQESATAEGNPPADSDVSALQARVQTLRENIDAARKRIQADGEQERLSIDAERKTKEAAAHHADVQGWSLIADALAPDGIPAELLSQALQPLQRLLAQSAADTGWMPVTLGADMELRAGGRPYALLSESEKWRVDAQVTLAIAQLSGLKLALLDRMDVLDLTGRSEALGWLDLLAADQAVDSVIVAATLKTLPALPETMLGIWINHGSAMTGNTQTNIHPHYKEAA